MTSARQDPFGARLAPVASPEDQSGLRLRSDWADEAGHRLDDVDDAPASESFDLLASLYDESWDEEDTVVCPELAPVLEPENDVEPSLELDIDLAEPSLDIDIDVAVAPSQEISLEIDLDLQPEARPERVELEAAVALRSDSHLWEGFDGELGVFVATVTELPLGTPVALTLHLAGEPTITVSATVRFLRDDPNQWHGLGLELDRPTAYLREAFRRFAHLRPPAFYG